MACDPGLLRQIPLFALLDDDEMAVLAEHVELKTFAARERIYKAGDEGRHAYALIEGMVRITTVDDDHQEVVVDEPEVGGFFGFASMLDETRHQTDAMAVQPSSCIEVDREDIADLLKRKPHAAMDMLRVLGRQIHGAQQLVRRRAARSPNELIALIASRITPCRP